MLNAIKSINQNYNTQNITFNTTKKNNIAKNDTPQLHALQKDAISFSSKACYASAALEIHQIGARELERFEAFCNRVLDTCQIRLKLPDSIENKLERKTSVQAAKKQYLLKTQDLLGAKKITDGSIESINLIVKKLVKEINAGSIRLTQIKNYRGVLNEAEGRYIPKYFTDDNILKLQTAQKDVPLEITESRGKESAGYTAIHILGKINGVPFEIQIKGSKVHKVDSATHILHNADIGKKLSIQKQIDEVDDVVNTYKGLSSEKRKIYDFYIRDCYYKARLAETNTDRQLKYPNFPHGIPNELRIQNLLDLSNKHGLA